MQDDDNGRLVRKPLMLFNLFADDLDEEKEKDYFNVDICYKIISSDSFLDKFEKMSQFWEDDEIDRYIDGVETMALKFQTLGFQFTDDQIRRIKDVTGLDIVNRDDFVDEEIEKATKFKKYFDLYVDDDLYERYLKSKNPNELINGIYKKELNQNMVKVLSSFKIYSMYLSEELINRYWRFRVSQDSYYKFYGDDNIELNPEFEKQIMKDIPKSLSDELMAYNLYIELNKNVSLDSRFYITKQVRDDEGYNKNIANKKIDEVNPNNLVCKTWSEIYYYLIKKYTNIDCYIGSNSRSRDAHHYVVLLLDNGETVAVDGTNVVHDRKLGTNFTDILRCKLGLPTVNFALFQDYHRHLEDVGIEKKEPKNLIEEIFNIVGSRKEIEELGELIKSNNLDTNSKLKLLMEFIENRKDLDSISMRALFSNLTYLFFRGNEKVSSASFYKELDDGQYEYVNCLCYRDKDTNEKIYLLFDKDAGFIKTSLEDIDNMMANGEIKDPSRFRL